MIKQKALLLLAGLVILCYIMKQATCGAEGYKGKEVTASVVASVYDSIVKETPELASQIKVLPSPSDVMRRINEFEIKGKREVTDPEGAVKKFIYKLNSIKLKTPSVVTILKR